MNRTRRKAAKMFRRKYGRSTLPAWQADPGPAPTGPAAFRAVFDACRPAERRRFFRSRWPDGGYNPTLTERRSPDR